MTVLMFFYFYVMCLGDGSNQIVALPNPISFEIKDCLITMKRNDTDSQSIVMVNLYRE